MAFHEGYLSEIVGRQAVLETAQGKRPIGKVVDLLVGNPGDTFPRVDGFVIRTREGNRFTPIGDVIDVDSNGQLLLGSVPVAEPIPGDRALYLVEDLLDKQIVDVNGRKVVRINDLELANTGGALRVIAADVGVGGLLRRVGGGRFAPGAIRRFPSSIIAWDNVAPISDVNPTDVRLSVAENRLSRLHP